MRSGLPRLPAFVRDMADTTAQVLAERAGTPTEEAEKLGIEVAAAICEQYRGSYLFVPKFAAHSLDSRDRQIASAWATPGPDGARAFTGHRVEQLAIEHGISTVQVYCILRRQRRLDAEDRRRAQAAAAHRSEGARYASA